MPVPVFTAGETLDASEMNAVGLWRVTGCTVSSVGGTAATASNGVITIGTNNTSVTVNNAFSSDYDNYLIVISGGTGSTSTELRLRFGAAVTNYKFVFVYTAYNNTIAAVATNAGTSIEYTGQMTSSSLGAYITVQNPFLTEHTFVQSSSSTETFAGTTTGHLANTTSYTDFTIFVGTGSMTGGTIRVYGYRN